MIEGYPPQLFVLFILTFEKLFILNKLFRFVKLLSFNFCFAKRLIFVLQNKQFTGLFYKIKIKPQQPNSFTEY